MRYKVMGRKSQLFKPEDYREEDFERIPEDYREILDIDGVKSILPPGHRIHKIYRAYEGDTRVITIDRQGIDHRWVIGETEAGRFWYEKP